MIGFVFVLVMVALVVLGVAALVTVHLWRAGRWGIAVLVVLVATLGWGMYRAADPGPAFYRDLFQDQTGLAFPDDGRFVAHTAMVPDMTGDYCASAIVEIDAEDAERLRQSLDDPTSRSAMGCEDVSIDAGAYRAVYHDSKDGSMMWWGVSHDGHRLAFSYSIL